MCHVGDEDIDMENGQGAGEGHTFNPLELPLQRNRCVSGSTKYLGSTSCDQCDVASYLMMGFFVMMQRMGAGEAVVGPGLFQETGWNPSNT